MWQNWSNLVNWRFGREIKMIQLKKEINEYLNKQGLEGKYEIVE